MKNNIKLLLELLSLLSFFIAYKMGGLMVGTKVLMITSLLSISIIIFLHKKPDPSQIVTVVLIQVMGTITLLSNDSTFIKMKPTLLYMLLATALILGLCFKRYFIKTMLESILELDEKGWKKVTISWALYFTTCALVNELVWRNFSEDFWVSFKVFAFIPITLIFTSCQLFALRRHIKS
jgi:intracellular septation protein